MNRWADGESHPPFLFVSGSGKEGLAIPVENMGLEKMLCGLADLLGSPPPEKSSTFFKHPIASQNGMCYTIANFCGT